MDPCALPDVPLTPRIPGCRVPLTASQLRLWRDSVNHGAPRGKLRQCAASLRLLGSLDIGRLRNASDTGADRHESLRIRVAGPELAPRQLIDRDWRQAFSVVDLSEFHRDHGEESARRAAEEFLSEEIDVAAGPLFAGRVFKLSEEDHILVLGVDHFVSDAVSFSILIREICTLYREGAEFADRCLRRLSIQFPDFAVWQADTQEAWTRRESAYWMERLTSVEKIVLPLDDARSSRSYPKREFLHIPFGKGVSAKLADIARRDGTLTPLVVLGIQLLIMAEWCQRDTLLVEVLSHGRKGPLALESMIGFLAYPMYLLVEVLPTETFDDLIRRITEEFHSASRHDASRTTGYLVTGCPTEVGFNWIQTHASAHLHPPAMGPDLRVRPFRVIKPWAVTLQPHYYHTASGIVAELWYGRGLFHKHTLEWLENGFRAIARRVAQTPDARIDSLRALCAR